VRILCGFSSKSNAKGAAEQIWYHHQSDSRHSGRSRQERIAAKRCPIDKLGLASWSSQDHNQTLISFAQALRVTDSQKITFLMVSYTKAADYFMKA